MPQAPWIRPWYHRILHLPLFTRGVVDRCCSAKKPPRCETVLDSQGNSRRPCDGLGANVWEAEILYPGQGPADRSCGLHGAEGSRRGGGAEAVPKGPEFEAMGLGLGARKSEGGRGLLPGARG